ncbi:MAG: SRPBCC family protein [Solirubrobacterales bacterium]
MPHVGLDQEVRAPIQRVWETVLDVEDYPSSMENVRWVQVRDRFGAERRRTAWSIVLKGSILEWEEEEAIDHESHVMSFHQLTGDLSVFEGHWSLSEAKPGLTTVTFEVEFEIGVPLLAEMLNPVAKRSLHENCGEMLRGVERQAVGT